VTNSEHAGKTTSAVRWYRAAAILALNTLLIFGALELGSAGLIELKDLIQGASEESLLVGEGTPREKISYYLAQDWAPQFWSDFRVSRQKLRYVPYVGWRRPAFDGKTIKIDQDGIRFTPGADCRPEAYKVFAFGGSTMWGTGAPDWGTIPAYLQAGLMKLRSGPVCVVNFSETAYVSTQGVITLMMQLQAGRVPDLVVFYDGPSDIYAAYQSGRAGVPQNVEQLARIFEKRDRQGPFVEWLTHSASFSMFASVMRKAGITRPVEPLDRSPASTMTVPELSGAIVDRYVRNHATVSSLADTYRFKALFFWQPYISIGHKQLTTEEREIRAEVEADRRHSDLIRAVYARVANEAGRLRNLYDLTSVFDGHDGLVWIDGAHVTPPGNELLAARMLELARASLVGVDPGTTSVSASPADRRTGIR
jgi:lysophospholipase L1-like esterase